MRVKRRSDRLPRVEAKNERRDAETLGANRLLAAAAGGGLTTLTGMVRVYDGPFIRSLDLHADDADINIEIIDRARGCTPGSSRSRPTSTGRSR